VEKFTPPDTAKLGIPVMIIEADNDPLVEQALREQLKRTYPAATVHTLRGAGHFPYLNKPGEYTRLLWEFLSANATVSRVSKSQEG
jgi:pimeloyl-ACP methyl ester carboxylesterase